MVLGLCCLWCSLCWLWCSGVLLFVMVVVGGIILLVACGFRNVGVGCAPSCNSE